MDDILSEMPLLDGPENWQEWYEKLSPSEREELKSYADIMPRVAPQEGPQRTAFNSKALITGYGGAAGGGKSALIALLALLSHQRSVVWRYDAKQLRGLIDDVVQFYGTQTGLNRQAMSFYFNDQPGHMMEWGGIGEPGAEKVWQGRPHDFLAADEVTQLALAKLIWLMTWCRSVKRNQRCRVLWTFNPPGAEHEEMKSTADGTWVIDFFAPWLDERHENPAEPGALRWYITNEAGEQQEVPNNDPVELKIGGEIRVAQPQSRTFIPASVQDNAYLRGTNYENVLMQHPEPLRSQMLLGDFRSGIVDSPTQIIPTRWVDEAMERWTPDGKRAYEMSAMGVDVARGGRAKTVLARRHKFWWDKLIREPGSATPDGDATAALCVRHNQGSSWICIDANGVGASPFDSLKRANVRVHGILGQVRKGLRRLPGRSRMYNLRTWLYFCLRHILDPKFGFMPALPKDNRLRSDLIAVHFSDNVAGGQTLAESKEDIRGRIRRSTDDGDAVALSCFTAFMETEMSRLDIVAKSEDPLEPDYPGLPMMHEIPVTDDQAWMGM